MNLPACPNCNENHTYMDGNMYVCPMCFHEWSEADQAAAEEAALIRDVNGNILEDGDDAFIATDLRIGKDTLKRGTKVKGIRILDDEVDGHDLQAKVDGFGTLYLKSSVVRK